MNLIILIVFLFSLVSGAKIRKLIDFLEKDAPNDIEKAPNYNEESVAFRRGIFSIQTKKTIVNTVLLKSLRLTKGANSPLTDKELADIDIEVEYECICQKGTFGGLCDESDVDRKCQEVYCLGRGKGTCEQLSACFDTQCQNGGVCEDVVDWQTKTVTATCKCPQTLEIIGGTVTGENCENLKIPDTIPADLVPCAAGRNSWYFFERLIAQIDIGLDKDIWELGAIQKDYHDGETKNGKMDSGWCKNDGKCVAEVIRVQTSRAYYIHRCECPNRLTDGYYCEYKRHDACSLTREELARGARWDEKCTDSQHGACVDINGEATCVCKPDYTGETCEVFDPCARHPCKHGDCIPIPSSADVAFGTSRFQCLCPLSAKLDTENNDCVEINEKKCAKGVCGNGRCVPCDSDIPSADDLMPLCNPNEKAQGFRCLCESGYLPPFCKIHTNPCYHNLCQNSGTCRVDPKTRSYDCQCLNGTRGSLCETIDDSCDAFGSKICVHGVCVNDAYFHRGFSCECVEGFEGFDCDVAVGWSSVWYSRFERNYQYTGPLLACLLSLIVMFPLILMSRRRRDEASLAPTSSSDGGTKVEEGKSMNI
ncbi:hypothetical protein GCK72_003236 [Caenorhabditis remanei]|uniref:EGF-like domain-containing protein n=1 Tax=Caenorhabditis remanei TaxID=31234 RepID=A0A6A5HT85_CAERE|nr:hypothetical protein GCK72_003236 [Caenorhabditis remanei]KAF1771410.1 hypothetical protein GCK72_003236 [Caenorhabditis remanei]